MTNHLLEIEAPAAAENLNALAVSETSTLSVPVPRQTQAMLLRMFRDPHLLEKNERTDLVAQLRQCVEAHPEVSDLRVMLGMALCVNYEVQTAIDELQEGLRLAPQSFIAHLKMGELWMHLRVCDKAEEHTRMAGELAQSMLQADMARKQAATIRKMVREGIERGGYKGPLALLGRLRKLWKRDPVENSIALDVTA